MRFSHWFRRAHQPAPSYRPSIDLLEDRVVPALLRHFPAPVTLTATHLQVIVPQDVESGKAFGVIVEALDARNHLVTGFKGTVQLKLATTDAGATLPASFTFSAADRGKHTLQATLTVSGAQTVKANSGVLAGQGTLNVDAAVTHFSVAAFGLAMAGSPTLINVVALDASNNAVPGYMGTVHFSSTDLLATLPDDYSFNAADGGSHLFAVTFGFSGSNTIVVTDAAHRSITGGVSVRVHWWWYDPGYGSYDPYSYGSYDPYSYGSYNPYGSVVSYPVYGVAGYPAVGVVSGFPGAGVFSANTSGIGVWNPIGNISYGANLFGNGTSIYSPTDPIANISYGLNPFSAAA